MRSRRRCRRFVCVLSLRALAVMGVAITTTSFAWADPKAEEQALATTLFREGKALLDAGKIAEACRKLEESHRLYPGSGTLLNLAVCHEKEGKTATAWAEFRQARVTAERDGREDRLTLAEERLKVLEPKLSKVTIEVGAETDLADMEVSVDDRAVRRPTWGTAMPVDPGAHTIEARAPRKKTWRTQVMVAPDADMKTIAIPAWEDEDEPPPSPPAIAPAPARSSADNNVVDNKLTNVSSSSSTQRTAALLTAGAGVAFLGVGTYFGLHAISKHDEIPASCKTTSCAAASTEANDLAKTSADLATIAFGVGIVGLGVGAYLWFTSGDAPASKKATSSSSPRAVANTLRVVPDLRAIHLMGTF